jgi:hypothetical protein
MWWNWFFWGISTLVPRVITALIRNVKYLGILFFYCSLPLFSVLVHLALEHFCTVPKFEKSSKSWLCLCLYWDSWGNCFLHFSMWCSELILDELSNSWWIINEFSINLCLCCWIYIKLLELQVHYTSSRVKLILITYCSFCFVCSLE